MIKIIHGLLSDFFTSKLYPYNSELQWTCEQWTYIWLIIITLYFPLIIIITLYGLISNYH